ncbi:hypothetical protein Pfo_030951 [Paulownia fortunei]|nr:hypothetical protein Pfo_030951 [Paulownia fortunei]
MAQNGRHTNAVPAIDNNTAAATNRNYVGNTTGSWGYETEYEKKKAEIVFVFDRSYSMISNGAGTNGADVNRLQQAKEAFSAFTNEVGQYVNSGQLQVGLVTYSDGIKSTRAVSNNINAINQDIQNITINMQNDAGTYTDGAIKRAQKLLDESTFNSGTKLIVLISDGAASQHDSQKGSTSTDMPWTATGGTYNYNPDEPLLGHADGRRTRSGFNGK